MMTPMLGLVLLPIYMEFLSPAEYGIMTTVQTISGLLQLVLVLSLNGAITRFYYDYLDQLDKQRKYLGSIFTYVILFSTTISIVLLVFSKPIVDLLFKNIPTDPYYIYLIGLSWASAILSLPMALLRAQEKAGLFVLLSTLQMILIMAMTAYLIIVKGQGAEGALTAQFLITFAIALLAIFLVIKSLKFTLAFTYVKDSLLFSIPLLPHVASLWIINSSDRMILEKFVDPTDLGIYSLAAQVSMVLGLFYSSVNNALVPRYTRLRIEGQLIRAKQLLKVLSFVVLICGVASIPIATYALPLFTSDEYLRSVQLIPLLLVGQIVTGFYFIPVAKLFYAKKTGAIAKSSSIAAITSILINLVLIPFIGLYGAAISAIISAMVRFGLIYRASNKISSL